MGEARLAEAERLGGLGRNVDNTTTDERPSANDRHDRGAAIVEVDDPGPGSHRQATMCRNQSSITRILKIRCQSLFRRRCRTGKSAEHRTEKYGTSHPLSLSALALLSSAAGRARSQLRGSHKIRQNKTRQDHLLFYVPPNACRVALGKRQTRSGRLRPLRERLSDGGRCVRPTTRAKARLPGRELRLDLPDELFSALGLRAIHAVVSDIVAARSGAQIKRIERVRNRRGGSPIRIVHRRLPP